MSNNSDRQVLKYILLYLEWKNKKGVGRLVALVVRK